MVPAVATKSKFSKVAKETMLHSSNRLAPIYSLLTLITPAPDEEHEYDPDYTHTHISAEVCKMILVFLSINVRISTYKDRSFQYARH